MPMPMHSNSLEGMTVVKSGVFLKWMMATSSRLHRHLVPQPDPFPAMLEGPGCRGIDLWREVVAKEKDVHISSR